MKKILLFAILAMSLFLASCTDIPAGYVGVKVHVLGGKAGDIETVGVGRHVLTPNVDIFKYPTFNQTYVWSRGSDEGSPKDEQFVFLVDGLSVEADVGIEYRIDDTKVSTLFETYRKGIDEITGTVIRNSIRNKFISYGPDFTIDELISEGGTEKLRTVVFNSLRDEYMPKGIEVINISINKIMFPQAVNNSIEAKTKATQDAITAENALRQAEANKKRAIIEAEQGLEVAKLESEKNKLLNSTYTAPMIEKMWIEKWDGKLPVTVTGDSTSLFMPIK